MREDFSFFTHLGNNIRVSNYFEGIKTGKPCLILVHGFKGFKDWGFWPYTAEFFSKAGFNVFSFNFSHNGVGNSLTEFDDLYKFAENTISLEVDELNEIVDSLANDKIGNNECKSIGIIGHSRGGAVSLLVSSKNENVDCLVLWASVSRLDRYTERQKKEWREKGFIEVLNSRTNQMMRMNVKLLEDIESNKYTTLNLESAAKNFKKPLLIVHGEQDLTVPVEEGKQLYEWSDKNFSEIEIIESTGHTFDVVHPFLKSNKKFETVLHKSFEFLNKNLSRK